MKFLDKISTNSTLVVQIARISEKLGDVLYYVE
jgi:hypothetical protein